MLLNRGYAAFLVSGQNGKTRFELMTRIISNETSELGLNLITLSYSNGCFQNSKEGELMYELIP